MAARGRWTICSTCDGDGKHSRALGVVNPDDFDHDDWEHYLEGGYDQTCGTCGGSGKVREDDERAERAHAAALRYDSCLLRNEAGEPMETLGHF